MTERGAHIWVKRKPEAITAWNSRAGNDTNVATDADYTRNMRKGE